MSYAISCKKDNPARNTSITSFTPSSGAAGTPVSILGSGLGASTIDNLVSFNGVPAQLASATSTSLVAIVPLTATSGRITVTVNGTTVTSASDFVVTKTTITSFTPTSGTIGSSITINGTNFGSTVGNNVVKFNGIAATVTAATSTLLTVTVPVNATTGKINVVANGSLATSIDDFIIDPKINSFLATSGVAGDVVDIRGSGFGATAADNVVKFNGEIASFYANNATPTRLLVYVPLGATTGKISVQANSGTVVTATNDFTILSPNISNFSPNIGATGTRIDINGTNFSNNSAFNIVKFNGVQAEVYSSNNILLAVNVPAAFTTGKISVTVGPNTTTSSSDFQVCSGAAELVIGYIGISSIASDRTSFYYDIHLTNAGDTVADFANEVVHAYVSKDAADNGNDLDAGSWALSDHISELYPNRTYSLSGKGIIPGGETVDSYPYLVLKISGPVAECNTTNNTGIRSIP
jgi:hypothetical protein